MGPKSAARLARLCAGGVGASVRVRRAWARLAHAASLGDRNALVGVWRLWLASPQSDELWDVLARRLSPGDLADAALVGVTEPDRSPESRAAIGESCVRRGVVPEEETRRALFHVLTSQLPHHIEADPDGRSLAAAYSQANSDTRAAVRRAIVRSADLDLVRVVAGAAEPRGINELAGDERRFLLAGLAARHDWDRLWRLVRDLPIADAVACARRFPEDWRPVGGRERIVFGCLSRADRDRIAGARDAVSKPEVVRLELDDAPTHGSFSPDGRRLLLATGRGHRRYTGCRVLDMPSGAVLERHDFEGDLPPVRVLHLGRSFVVVGQRLGGPSELVRYENGRPTVLYWSDQLLRIARTPTGFALLATGLASQSRTWGDGPVPATSVYFCDAQGDVVTEWQSAAIPQGGVPGHRFWIESDPAGRRLAYWPAWSRKGLYGDLIDPHGNRLTTVRLPVPLTDFSVPRPLRRVIDREDARVRGACFTADGPVAIVDDRDQILLCRSGPGVALVPRSAKAVFAQVPVESDLVFLPDRGEIALLDLREGVRYLDARTLTDAQSPGDPGPLSGEHGTMLTASPDGRCLALGGRDGSGGFLQIAWDGHPDEAATLARRPMADWTERDLAAFAAPCSSTVPAEARPILDLTRECLKARFAPALTPTDAGPPTTATTSDGEYLTS
ncbi:MAG TPA: hypothetical protein VFU73_08325 [Actinocrinis sp.]|nr:hypothetical protein [Actinocrinis sp.]